jgi:3-dehydroquinate dehydratase/shikimate dehydrogenase
MFPNINDCFFRNCIPGEIVFDMVYNPLETMLIQHAREQGKTIIPGLEMFIEQAAQQFEIWTGEAAPRSVMEKAALEALELKVETAKPENGKPDNKAPDNKNSKGVETK